MAREQGRVLKVEVTFNTSRQVDAELEEDQEDNMGKTHGI